VHGGKVYRRRQNVQGGRGGGRHGGRGGGRGGGARGVDKGLIVLYNYVMFEYFGLDDL